MKETKTVLKLSIPIIIETILQTLLGTTDVYFAGRVGDVAIAGISITNLIMNIFIAFFSAVSVGSIAVVSRYFGKKDNPKVKMAVMQSILVAILLGIIAGIINLLFPSFILRLSRADKAIIASALPYYRIVGIPVVFLALQMTLSSCLRAMKNTKAPMYITGISNVLNIGLNTIFVSMGMGVFGLGLATTLSRAVGVVLLFFSLRKQNQSLYFSYKDLFVHTQTMKQILSIGVPGGIEKLVMRMGQLLYNGMILSIGVHAYVAHNIAGTVENYTYIPSTGFGLAVSTLVGVSLGERNPQQGRSYVYKSYFISAFLMLLMGVGFFLFAPELANFFTNTKEVQVQVIKVLRFIAFFQPFSALVQVLTCALQGAGDTKFSMYTTFAGIWGIRLCLGYYLGVVLELGLMGVWYAYALDLVLRGTILYWRFRKGKWMNIEL